jgi:hypothetical protein
MDTLNFDQIMTDEFVSLDPGLFQEEYQDIVEEGLDDMTDEELIQEAADLVGKIALGVAAGLLIFFIARFVAVQIRMKPKMADITIRDIQMNTRGDSPLSIPELNALIKEVSKQYNVPIAIMDKSDDAFSKAGVASVGNNTATLGYTVKTTVGMLRVKSGLFLQAIVNKDQFDKSYFAKDSNFVIVINPHQFAKLTPMKTLKEVNMTLAHEYGHVLTLNQFQDKRSRVDYIVKSMWLGELVRGDQQHFGFSDDQRSALLSMVYNTLPIEAAANEAGGVNVIDYVVLRNGVRPPANYRDTGAYKFAHTPIPNDIENIMTKVKQSNEDKLKLIRYQEEIIRKFGHGYVTPEEKAKIQKAKKKLNVVTEGFVQEAGGDTRRKRIEELVYNVFTALDPTGINTKKYQAMFQSMSDQAFQKWVTAFLSDPKSGFRWDIEEYGDGSRAPKFENIEKASKVLGIKLFEYVYIPHVSSNKNRPVRTKHPVLVGYQPAKRTQQLGSKKTNISLSDTNRDDMTGAAKGDAKSGTTTGIESELLSGVGADEVISEFNGMRGDNTEEYNNAIAEIASTGSVKLENVKTNPFDKKTLLMADLYLIGMGLKTDLITEAYYSTDKFKQATGKK